MFGIYSDCILCTKKQKLAHVVLQGFANVWKICEAFCAKTCFVKFDYVILFGDFAILLICFLYMGMLLEVKNLHKSFGNKIVLSGVNLTVEPSESFVVLGGSGCGKSVFLKHIARLMTPDEGEVSLNGVNIQTIEQDAYPLSKIGVLFQEIGLFDFMNVWENVAFHYTEVLGYNRNDAKRLALEHLEEVGIGEISAHIQPSEASLGMQKRIGLARVLVSNPELILLDEPTSGLDTISSQKIAEVSLKQIKKMNATAITVTHDLKLAKFMGDRIGLMHKGKFEWIGTPSEFEKTDNKIVQHFIAGIGEDLGEGFGEDLEMSREYALDKDPLRTKSVRTKEGVKAGGKNKSR